MSEYNLSVSRIKTFLTCQQKYYLQYVEGLQRKSNSFGAMNKGKLIHELIEKGLYYIWECQISTLEYSDDELLVVLSDAADTWADENRASFIGQKEEFVIDAMTVVKFPDEQMSVSFEDEVEECLRIAEHFFSQMNFWDNWEILTHEGEPLVEFNMLYPVPGTDFVFNGKIDAVMRDKNTGLIHMIDWKTRQRFSSYQDEMVGMQIPIYLYVLRQLGIEADVGTIYQIRSIAPRVPNVTKSGTTSKQAITTTWEVYRAALIANGENPEDYADEMVPKLADTVFHEPITIRRNKDFVDKVWRQFIHAANEMERVKEGQEPTYAYGYSCRSCQFRDVCHSELSDYDTDKLKEIAYTKRDK
jgi:CRISPR/Cas system-associated exonuclease Cas4 (RecB family)